MTLATEVEIEEIFAFYKDVVAYMNTKGPKIGWNTEKYPDLSFVKQMVRNQELFIVRENEKIICAAAVNYEVNPEYDDIAWTVKGPREKIATIHALAVSPLCRGKNVSDAFLKEIEEYCRESGNLAIHFDVIEGNEPATKLYLRNGYREVAAISMYYEVVGTKEFHMMEKVL
ncbi:MAG: GNAT family N-acetyltransferase [Lachnospiraceae bacterium]|nr:GNAT family N-acetyltransferase [Lachnospiraceae bacterium]